MFRKTKLKVEEKKKSDALTIISENTFVTGDMSSEGEIHFEGVLEGNMKAACHRRTWTRIRKFGGRGCGSLWRRRRRYLGALCAFGLFGTCERQYYTGKYHD